MSKFTGPLQVELLEDSTNGGRGTWKLLVPFGYESDIAGELIIVHAGYVTDFASIPRLPLIYLLLGEKGDYASTVHDWLYSINYRGDRELCDKILHEALITQGVSEFDADIIYAGVRVGGESHW